MTPTTLLGRSLVFDRTGQTLVGARRATAELRTPFVCPALTALDPRARPTEIDRDLARHQLGRELGDVDGDGRADLVGLGDGYIGAILSTGSDFGSYQTWWDGSFYGSHGTFLGDINGDGRADLVGLGDGYIGALLATP